MSGNASTARYLDLTAQIVAAHVERNAVPVEGLPGLIQSVFRTLSSIEAGAAPSDRPEPAVPIKRSVFPGYIVCLDDGKKLKMLKRHLKTAFDMTPAQYRERWGLPADYPMVAPDYAEQRSALAKSVGLGRKRHPGAPATAADTPARRKTRGPGRPKLGT